MKLELLATPQAYLRPCAIIDFNHPAIQAKAAALRLVHAETLDLIRASFEFVRDEIRHSWDAQSGPVTLKASEVLLAGFGYCYAKSHLLAALLRANGIPAGLCYQRLSIGDGGAPYCLHGLNAVLLPEHGWYRLDARGNKPGVDARFTPPLERLAFPVKEAHAYDFPQLFASPRPEVVTALSTAPDIFWLYQHLPDTTPGPANQEAEVMTTDRLVMTPLSSDDAQALLDYETRNKIRFAPHGPRRGETDFRLDACERRIQLQLEEIATGRAVRWTLRPIEDPATIIGHITLSAITRGVRQSAALGYGIDAQYEGRGLMTEAVSAAIGYAFSRLKLHRIEACHRPDNPASARVMTKAGLQPEGLARGYLLLDGVWEDQILNAICNPDWQLES